MSTQLVGLSTAVAPAMETNRAALMDEIRELARERNAIILAHNYQLPDVQDVADFTGDSLGLSLEAQKTDAQLIVFCGVDFMAEPAHILYPSERVLLPYLSAGSLLAGSIIPEKLG